ncbi:phosphoglycerate dehydrogenase [Marinigracilibium pacificum]|uniref:D-3-phosphoglycerate dehydrogenase n=1 Tax=Marinigracilibium pacificum TaxID=2729599 RepID=A0A848J494_9BACT|nr:phosphoglycerate dehydrogenase [Marinigracilibium pacificum]NMM47992.1 phosphoglycerate dehydrogenase [Marinigracilibium pacificum]
MTPPVKNFVIDFDSTFTKVEGLDLLVEMALNNHADKHSVVKEVKEITDKGMSGELGFEDSLKKRIALLKANKSDVNKLSERLKTEVSSSFKRNRDFFKEYSENIYIVSSGFKDFILPVVEEMGVKPENVYANEFRYDEENNIIGFDESNVLAKDNGKVTLLKNLKLQGDIYVIGDGYTDYEIKASGLANKFYAFTENVSRGNVLDKADHIAPSLDEILYLNKMNTAISYPKNRINVLLLENIHQDAVNGMIEEGYNVEVYPAGLDEDELCEKIKNVSILGIRSKTQVTKKVLEHANRLIAVGAFCIGTNQIDLEACLEKGVAVFNAPYSNTRSVVELALGEIILLMRNIPDKNIAMHNGEWNKSATGSVEIRGKKLGIIGYGNIGAQLSILAEGAGMDVHYYDIEEKLALGNATKCNSLEELLSISDVISLHVDGRPENTNIIGEKEFSMMKKGVVFLNLSRGQVVDIKALADNIRSGKIRGAGVDVFPEEPKGNDDPFVSELLGLPNLILTPHIGGSTLEAQKNIADFVPGKIIQYINTGSTTNSVNFPNLQLPTLENAHRLIHIHINKPGIMAKMNNVLLEHDINIMGQYLKTNEKIGYVITDIDKQYDKEVISALKAIDGTVKFRVLY